MRADAGSHSTAASGDQLLPPVFTQWSAHDRANESHAEHEAVTPQIGEQHAHALAKSDASAGVDSHIESLAARLERLAERLRSDGQAALSDSMNRGDRLDAALAGLLKGYLTAAAE
jgi:hypothetical protein